MNQAVLILTHIFDRNFDVLFLKIRCDLPEEALYIISSDSVEVPPKYKKYSIIFSYFDIQKLKNEGVLDFDMDLARVGIFSILKRAAIPKYAYYWFIEYDVWYSGNWSDIIRTSSLSDLLATHLHSYTEVKFEKNWVWWPYFLPKGVPQSFWSRGYLPIYRLSFNGLKIMRLVSSLGWRGHFESIIPTAINYFGGSIEELGGQSKYTPQKRKGKFYRNYPAGFMNYIGTMRCTPHIFRFFKKNTLYHPLKNLGKSLNSLKYSFKRIHLYFLYFFKG